MIFRPSAERLMHLDGTEVTILRELDDSERADSVTMV